MPRWVIPSTVLVSANILTAIYLAPFVGLPSPSLLFLFSRGTLLGLAFMLFVAGLWGFIEIAKMARERRSLGELRGRFSLWYLYGSLLAVIGLSTFNAIKSTAALLVTFRFDGVFADIDHALFGMDAWQLFESLSHPVLFDLYHPGWLAWTLFALGYVLLTSNSRGIVAYFLMWSLGPLLHLAIPAAGPIFFDQLGLGDRFMAMDLPPKSLRIEAALWYNYINHQLGTVAGISAMPSLHMATMAWAVIVLPKWLKLFAVAAFFYIWLGSILTGWHYFVDGVGGFLVALAAWLIAKPIVDWKSYIHRP